MQQSDSFTDQHPVINEKKSADIAGAGQKQRARKTERQMTVS